MLFNHTYLLSAITGKLTWIFLLVAVVIIISFLKDKKQKGKKVIFFGDSLTEYGANRGGYIYLMKRMLKEQQINDYNLVGAGIAGNKVTDLQERLMRDVISKSPDIVVIWIGINDVWHKYSHANGTDEDTFNKTYRNIVKQLLADNIKTLLITPSVVGEKTDRSNLADDELDTYSQLIRNIAADYHLPLCDMRLLFALHEKENNHANVEAGILTHDTVHLNDAGNKFVAEEMWKALKAM